MPFNVSTFKEQISSLGYLTPSRYELIVTPPSVLSSYTLMSPSNAAQQLKFRVEAITAPSVSIQSLDINRYGVGVAQKQPFNAAYNTMSFTFISDGHGYLWEFWHSWLQYIFGFSSINVSTNGLINSQPNYSLSYKSEYSTILSLYLYDNQGNTKQIINYNEAFPLSVSDVQLSWGSTDQLLKINVVMAFTDYNIVIPTTINSQIRTFQ